jgi:hypothetical protein
LVTLTALVFGSATGCAAEDGEKMPTPTDSALRVAPVIEEGVGDFLFEGEERGKPIRVWYSAPAGDLATADMLIVMTGAQRDGRRYRSDWLPLLEGSNTLLLVPEFSEDEYPGSSSYNLGGLVDSDGDPRDQDSWSFNMVEQLFDHVVDELDSTAEDYAMFGHSAGAQFVHRFVEFMPESRARIAVAANAGWYTVLDDSVDFPHGLHDAPRELAEMETALSRELVVLLGADDIDSRDNSLQRDRKADRQGTDRLARGMNFYQTAREAAGTDMPFNWHLIVVPGIAHSHADMARVAAPLVLNGSSDDH